MEVIVKVKNTFKLEVREESEEGDYLDAVIQSRDVLQAEQILSECIGNQIKDNVKKYPEITGELKAVIEELGGVWEGQSIYLKEEEGNLIYGILRPWGSNPSNVTLAIGIRKK